MQHRYLGALLLTCGLALAVGARAADSTAAFVKRGQPHWGLLEKYCSECHNTTDWAGGVAFDALAADKVPDDAETWERAVRRLRGRLMPPPGSPQPPQAQIDQFVGWMESYLDAGIRTPRTGHVPVQRLSRTEYANAIRGLLGVEVKVEDLLPPEIEVEGFDNIAAALSVSPAFLGQYVGAARLVARRAVGEAAPKLAVTYYPVAGNDSGEGMPLGSRGGMLFRHDFPADGEYRINLKDLDVGLYPSGMESRQTVVILIDGKEIFRRDLGGPDDLSIVDRTGADGRADIMKRFSNIPATVTAGAHEIVITFIERSRAESDEAVAGGGFGGLRQARMRDGVEIAGPFNPTGLSLSASRQKIFVCEPRSAAEEASCARRIAEHLTRRAFRRPPQPEEIDRLMPFYVAGRQEPGGFNTGITQLVAAVISSPDFLYRAILPPEPKRARAQGHDDGVHRLSDLELASRLAFFLWAQGPDDPLIELASRNRLSQRRVLDAQVTRMLADPRASSLVTGFAAKWLNLDELGEVEPDTRLFPGFGAQLRADFARELELFLGSVLLGEQSVVRILDSDVTFLNERLARHYGITSVRGPQFRRVRLEDEHRWGILGKSAMLLRTSYGDRTSPVLRGAWVLEKILGTPPAAPPPNVVTDLTQAPEEKPTTVRARLELHRTAPGCNSCHGVIDPIGIALENFNVTGQWHDRDELAGVPIDAATVMPNGTALTGPVQLREELLRRPEQFVQAITQKLLMYGIGRELEYHDMPQVRAIARAAKKDDYTLSAIVRGIVNSDAFRLQSTEPHAAAPSAATARTE